MPAVGLVIKALLKGENMEKVTLDETQRNRLLALMGEVAMFRTMKPEYLEKAASAGEALTVAPGEKIVEVGQKSSAFFLIVEGHAAVYSESESGRSLLTEMGPASTFGEIGLLLQKPRTASIVARDQVLVLKFNGDVFRGLFKQIPTFGWAVAAGMASRLVKVSGQIDLPDHEGSELDESEAGRLLPLPFIQRHRLLPLKMQGDTLTVGFVDDPDVGVLNTIQTYVPGVRLQNVRIGKDYFNSIMRTRLGTAPAKGPKTVTVTPVAEGSRGCELDPLLERGLAEGVSDLHLTPGKKPGWRLDGDIISIVDAPQMGPNQLYDIFKPFMEGRHLDEFESCGDTDFGYALRNYARFRVNLYRDRNGTSASLRLIPSHISTLEQLGLPNPVKDFCALPHGLVVVTGSTGSGKSTTLAAMIDQINKTRRDHIITLEDPIEFLHENKLSMVNQREMGGHATNFARAIRSGLREDPDVILVGETRDVETLQLVMEVANTGHLVLATLHTNSAVSTINRIIDMFPAASQNQVRATLSSVLQGVISQALCKRIAGGRVAAFEVMVMTRPIGNLIREGKTVQILNSLQAGKRDGHLMLNHALAELVHKQIVDREEALNNTYDRVTLANMLGPVRTNPAQADPRSPGQV